MRNIRLVPERAGIVSLVTGYVSHRAIQPSTQISPTAPLMTAVPAANLWVDADLKETQLTYMRTGQLMIVISDIYGNDVKYTGEVVDLDMGTDNAFSLLSTQNVTDN